MKYFILLALLFLSGCNGSSTDHGSVLLEPDDVYEIDGWGSNPDIYEFTPKNQPHMTCLLLVGGSDKAAGLFCFPKQELLLDD